YGARKLWHAARRAGLDIGRDQVARLMRGAGIDGVRRTKQVRTTRADPVAARHPDLVERRFQADAPNRLWITDLTYVPTSAGVAYVCFIVDAFPRMIVGLRGAGHMRTPMVLDPLEMARWSRGTGLDGLRWHSNAWPPQARVGPQPSPRAHRPCDIGEPADQTPVWHTTSSTTGSRSAGTATTSAAPHHTVRAVDTTSPGAVDTITPGTMMRSDATASQADVGSRWAP